MLRVTASKVDLKETELEGMYWMTNLRFHRVSE